MPGILITGASTGIGASAALHLDSLGHHVFAGVRKPEDGERLQSKASDRLTPVLLDISDEKQISAAVDTVRDELGTTRFAGVVNNAGVARGGPLEFLPIDEWREQIDVNVIGQVAVTQAFLPLIREGSGRIVFIGSIGGRVSQALFGPYSASKFAIEGIAETLRHELHPWGIKTVLVEPGAVRTEIWEKGRNTADRLEADADPQMLERYRPMIDKLRKGMAENETSGVDPIVVAKVIERALFASRPRARYLVGQDAKMAGIMSRLAPDSLKDVLVRRLG